MDLEEEESRKSLEIAKTTSSVGRDGENAREFFSDDNKAELDFTSNLQNLNSVELSPLKAGGSGYLGFGATTTNKPVLRTGKNISDQEYKESRYLGITETLQGHELQQVGTNAAGAQEANTTIMWTCEEHCIPGFCIHKEVGSGSAVFDSSFPAGLAGAEIDDLLFRDTTHQQDDSEVVHMSVGIGEEERRPAGPSKAPVEAADPETFRCDIGDCSKIFISKGNLRRHKRRAHRVKYVCMFRNCKQEFDSLSERKEHSVSHHLTCSVETCGRSFKKSVHVQDHMRKDHNEERVSCDVESCQMTFSSRKNMVCHKRNTHFPRSRVLCNIDGCGKSFNQRRTMLAHRRNIHDRKHLCMYWKCHGRFGAEALLHHHISTCHLNDVEPVCKLCGRRFTFHIDLNDHMLNFHSEFANSPIA